MSGRCGEGSPCEQLCRELHDGTYECGCGPGFELHVDGYGCIELNATRSTELSPDTEEDVLYQKDVSFSAELEIAPSNRVIKSNVSDKHIDDRRTQRLPTQPTNRKEVKQPSYTYTGERSKEVDGLRSLIEDGVSNTDLNIITDGDRSELKDNYEFRVTTQGPSLEQKVPGATSSPPWTAAVESCHCDACDPTCTCAHAKCKSG
ncbi:hypothetical protein ACJJTC_015388 [Scirpophaga incertulas]